MRADQSRAVIRVVPMSRFRASKTARFERRICLPTSRRSAMWTSTRSPTVRAFPALRDVGSPPKSISRSVSLTYSVASVFNRKVDDAYLPLRLTWARHVPCLVRTIVAITVHSFQFPCTERSNRVQNRGIQSNFMHAVPEMISLKSNVNC